MDHHRSAPYGTLWVDLDLGEGTRPWFNGGCSTCGPQSAAYDTIWNVRANVDMPLPGGSYGPRMNYVGFQTTATEASSAYDWWFEDITPAEIFPQNIWLAMRNKRVGVPHTDGGTIGVDAGISMDAGAGSGSGETPDAAVTADAGSVGLDSGHRRDSGPVQMTEMDSGPWVIPQGDAGSFSTTTTDAGSTLETADAGPTLAIPSADAGQGSGVVNHADKGNASDKDAPQINDTGCGCNATHQNESNAGYLVLFALMGLRRWRLRNIADKKMPSPYGAVSGNEDEA